MNIVIASKNRKKIEEIKRILEKEYSQNQSGDEKLFQITMFTLNDFPECPDVIEDGETFEVNAVKKALSVAKYTGMTALADDSGLEVYALGMAPGVRSARYAGKDSDDKKNLEKLLYEMRSYSNDKRKARFVCTVALASSEGETNTFHGFIEGNIGIEPKGSGGFGYDPVFYPEGYAQTFSEMDDDEKDVISHRGIALRNAYQYLRERKRFFP